jgi:DNA-binding XRE family transcriptional regulator
MRLECNNMTENVKFAVALRGARAMLGWGQQEFSDMLQVSKSTLARVETLEIAPKAELWTRALRLFKDAGVVVDISGDNSVEFLMKGTGLQQAASRLQDENQRRSDRKSRADGSTTVNVISGPRGPTMIKNKQKSGEVD